MEPTMLYVISAAPFEVAPLRTLWESHPYHPSITWLSCGIGPLQAAKAAQSLADRVQNQDVLFIGTAGTWEPFDKVTLCTINRALWCPPCVRAGLGECIDGIYPPITLDPAKRPPWLDLPVHTLVASSTISMSWETGPHVGALYGSTPTQTAAPWIENLEAYSCLQEIQTTCKSLGIVMAITNQIGPQSRLQWKAHMHQAALTTAHYLVNRVK